MLGRLYRERLVQAHAFNEVGYGESKPLNSGDDFEWRPAVEGARFVRTFPAGSGVEFACRMPPGRAIFRIRAIGGVGAGRTLFAGVHGVSARPHVPWFPHVVELPAGAPGQATSLEYEIPPESR